MTTIPLSLRLKKRLHRDIAIAQDAVMRELFAVFEDAVFHGGTAIWRCYGGNRFSEDIDVYLPKDSARLDMLFRNMESAGFVVKKRKIGDNSMFSSLELNGAEVRLEALFRTAKGSLGEYETADGNLMTVYTLTPEELVAEKAAAYLNRRKIRDLYDVFFLLRLVKDRAKVAGHLKRLVEGFKEPVDEKELRVLVIDSLTPTSERMLEYIKRH